MLTVKNKKQMGVGGVGEMGVILTLKSKCI